MPGDGGGLGGHVVLDASDASDPSDPSEAVLARRAFLVCAWLTALSYLYALLFGVGWLALDSWRLGAVALLGVLGGSVDLVCARMILAGRLQQGVVLFAANVLVVIGAIGVLVPEEVTTVVVASMMPVVFAIQFTTGWPARLVSAAGLLVAGSAMVGRFGLGWTSGLDQDALAWVDVGGAMLALVGLLVLVRQAHGVLESRTALLLDARVEAEQRRLRMEAAQRDAELKDDFVNLVSHELRTPLTSILGYVELILDGAGSGDSSDGAGDGAGPDAQRRMLAVVQANAQRLDVLVRDLLDVARLESGHVRLQCEPVDLAGVVRRVERVMAPLVSDRRQVLTVDVPAAGVVLAADPRRLEQVVTNLVSNAHKYSPVGARIAVTVAVAVSGGATGAEAVLTVRDTGIGMTREECDRLFTKLFRADHADVREAYGTGLGLVITGSLVELHGGRVEVDSEPGVGTVFTVRLPVGPAAGPATGPATGSATGEPQRQR